MRREQQDQRFGVTKLQWILSGLGLDPSHISELSSSSSEKASPAPWAGSVVLSDPRVLCSWPSH